MKPLVAFRCSVSKAFMHQAIGVSFDRDYYFDPSHRRGIDARCHAYTAERLRDLGAFHTESNLGRKSHFEPNQVLVGGIQPNLIIGMLLGAEFIPHEGGDADISPACWAGKPLGDLPRPESLLEHAIVRQFDDQIREVRRNPNLVAIPPFFWDASGQATIHGALTTAQKFFGEQFFLDMLMQPERARQALEWIVEANLALVRHYAALGGIEMRSLHVGECSSCMIGPTEWIQFVAPTLERLGRELAPVRLHSCGPSDHILQAARAIPAIASLDLGGETSPGRVRDIFGPDFPVSIAPPVKLLTGGSLNDLTAWTTTLLAENRGGPLEIVFHLEPQYPLDILRKWLAQAKQCSA
jgi:hypothetical protein